ncbi:MAG: DNA polymerase III subunit alpha [Candidatus Omnitrophica bacterium CG07_land_8_20_14_0_80_42_15]|uniref:DNA polymerase III subunit alpha n=1 Tax=Candidatus Aquitaenariimonas noxiae TaxID=1974741 RepID=A0A2J0KV35_9BACT|nr:MAG: DNA polymerase III subunit alpha [Candidatus Omnitrophica bacterium CG07_land_8_20_14_0_80_42_15]
MPKHSNFAHLHVHTQYSLLDGACLISPLLDLAVANKMPAIAITDHGNMFGAIEFYQQAMKRGIKPIIGCEIYLAPGSRFEKSSHGVQEASYHLILLVKDETGYKNLMRLVSIGYLEGFYYRPRVDKEVLQQYSSGLIALSACLKGEVPYLIKTGQINQAQTTAGEYNEIFGKGNFYLELQDNRIPEQGKVNKELLNISNNLGIDVVATNDIHYMAKEDARAHEVLLCIQTQTTLDDPNRMKFQTDEFYFKSTEKMQEAFPEVPNAISNSLQIVEKCNLELDFETTHLPHYEPPHGKTREEHLEDLCEKGLKEKYGEITDVVRNRFEKEVAIIKKLGYTSYFLITRDFVHYAKEKGIPVGPGRGSAAGSIVSYALGITNIDPLKYGLLFERFLNPERVTLPDIDIDFCYERRNEVIDYVVSKYSNDNVAQIITFGTMMAKGVIRDVGRVLGMPYAEVDKIAKLIPNDLNITLARAIDTEPELKNLYRTNPQITQLIDISLVLEGLTRHASTHAAGVVISEDALVNHVPLFKTSEGQITTGYPMTSLEKIGLLKMDFLGLRTLTVIDETCKIIKRTQGKDVDVKTILLDDPKTFKMLHNAESIGMFQLESSGMRDLLKKLKPERIEDIIALLALFRPGPIGSGMLDDFIKRKHGQVQIRYDHKVLEPVLKETYGIIVYQEQVMKIAEEVAGFSMAEADRLRRAISKKEPEVLADARRRFVEGAERKGIEKRIADKIFDQIEYFGGYGFNKSHSAAYALISYRTAYLKANYSVEFMTALLTSEKDNIDKIALYIDELERMEIKILPPDVNESFANFTVVGNDIRFGLTAVKNVGAGAVDSIIEARIKGGKFSSIYEFCERVDPRLVNRKVIESLIKCGAFNNFGAYRSQLTAILDKALEVAGGIQKDRSNGQFSFFDTFENQENFKKTFQEIPNIPEWSESQLLSFEKAMLGFYITKHPLARYERIIRGYSTCSVSGLAALRDGREVILGGIISKLRMTTTKKTGEKMAIIGFEDLDGTVEVLVFPSAYPNLAKHIKMDAILFIKGRLNMREEEPKIIASEMVPIDEVREKLTKAVYINLVSTGLEKDILETLKGILAKYPGELPVYLGFLRPDKKVTEILLGADFRVAPAEKLVTDIEELLGQGVIDFRN